RSHPLRPRVRRTPRCGGAADGRGVGRDAGRLRRQDPRARPAGHGVTSDARPRFALFVVMTVLAALLWVGVPRLGNVAWVWDNVWFEQYANLLGTKHRLPTKTESLEFSLPPGLPATAALLKGGAKALGPVDARVLPDLPRA